MLRPQAALVNLIFISTATLVIGDSSPNQTASSIPVEDVFKLAKREGEAPAEPRKINATCDLCGSAGASPSPISQLSAFEDGLLDKNELQRRVEDANNDPAKLLELSAIVDAKTGKELRKKAGKLLVAKKKTATPAEFREIGRQISQILRRTVHSPEQMIDVLGKPPQINRQLIFRRYQEQWRYQQPLPFVITWERQKGRNATVKSVHFSP